MKRLTVLLGLSLVALATCLCRSAHASPVVRPAVWVYDTGTRKVELGTVIELAKLYELPGIAALTLDVGGKGDILSLGSDDAHFFGGASLHTEPWRLFIASDILEFFGLNDPRFDFGIGAGPNNEEGSSAWPVDLYAWWQLQVSGGDPNTTFAFAPINGPTIGNGLSLRLERRW